MSAPAEALLAAQRHAVGALSKAFVAGKLDAGTLAENLDATGLRDDVDQGLLIDSLEVVTALGGEAPRATGASGERTAPEQATEAQRTSIAKLCKDRSVPEPDVIVSREQASACSVRCTAATA